MYEDIRKLINLSDKPILKEQIDIEQGEKAQLIDCLDCLKKVRNIIGFDFGRTGIVHDWFDENNIDYYNWSDLDMYIYYIENIKNNG